MNHYFRQGHISPDDLRLVAGEVHLWKINDSGNEEELHADEKNLLSGITLESVRRQFIASRAGIRRIVSAYLGCRPDRTIITRPDGGKPVVYGSPLEFSVSHTGGAVYAAIARMPVGLDMESRSRRTRSFMEIARRYFGERETASIANPESDEERHEMFLRHWVHKEAITKLTGEGIAKGLAHAEVCPDWSGKHGDRKVFMVETGDEGHLGAVAGFREFEVKGWFVL